MFSINENIINDRLKIIFVIFSILFFNFSGFSQRYEGTIIRVIDGDTYIFLTSTGSFTVRMLGIDAPERDQPFSRESSEFLSQFLNKKAVTKVNGTDKDDRSVGTLFVNGRNINLLSIKAGYAWHYKRYSDDQDYAAAEEYAQRNKLKIWSLPNPIPPWSWRQRRGSYDDFNPTSVFIAR
jgi:endonuclease YncB( thermonuclease family)